ncbi:S66 peptidase family protein [Virgibacillus sediminis]|uniref:LD-carboxypeptidase n=1 Tax=Virgibacillus sediminis TaxID=202260 RepID=A0ABV7A7C6_9BACI
MMYPQRLRKGDMVGVIAPASPVKRRRLDKGLKFLEELGLQVKLGKHVDMVYGYLAGEDSARLADFHDMVKDPDIKAIIFARGGYGTPRIASAVDYQLIRENPKIIWGYSDITYLHTAIRQKTGLVTFHGPMVASDMAKDDFDDLSRFMFQQLFGPTTLIYSEKISPLQTVAEGEAQGQLTGGNLSLLVSSLGTPFEIDTKGKLLLLEDIGEEPYRVDGMLNQLRLSGKLEEAAGIVVGDFAEAEAKLDTSLTLEEVFEHYLGDLGCPVLSGFRIGHCFPHFSVPLGTTARLSSREKTLVVNPGIQ